VADTCPDCGFAGAEFRSTKARGEYRRCLRCSNEFVPEEVAQGVEA
jgi:DNA topoisomerase-1